MAQAKQAESPAARSEFVGRANTAVTQDPSFVDRYVEAVEEELQKVEDAIAVAREKAEAARGSGEDTAPFHALRDAVRDVQHASSILRTGHPTPVQTKTFDDSEQVLLDAPTATHGTWGAEDLDRDDIHHGGTGLNRVAAQRVADAKRRDHAKQPIARPAPEDTPAALADVDDVHYGKDGLNRPAAERVRHAGK
jgi:hypothetical protein